MTIQDEQIDFVDESMMEKLLQLKDLYHFWNQQINVISRKDMDHFYIHHVLHSLAIRKVFDFVNNKHVMDLGCGGGFPGIPLAICLPDVHFHLVDSIGKKIKVVKEISAALALQNLSAEHSRAEDIANRKFDCIISRAVAPLKNLIQWSAPLYQRKNKDGYGLICLKGGDLHQEISESGKKVHIREIYPAIFHHEWFKEKYILQVTL